MKHTHHIITALIIASCAAVTGQEAEDPSKLKECKLIIEHNATDEDTGFQGAIDSEGWKTLDVTGPGGHVLSFQGKGALGSLGITELFFETVEPGNARVPVHEMLSKMPAGKYVMKGERMENGKSLGEVTGSTVLSHTIPAGPVLKAPANEAVVGTHDVMMKWSPVTQTITGEPAKIIAYQLIVEKDEPPHPTMVGKFALNVRFPANVTSMELPDGFLQPGTSYKWEVLAVEEGGNQTLSSAEFETKGGKQEAAKDDDNDKDGDEKPGDPSGK